MTCTYGHELLTDSLVCAGLNRRDGNIDDSQSNVNVLSEGLIQEQHFSLLASENNESSLVGDLVRTIGYIPAVMREVILSYNAANQEGDLPDDALSCSDNPGGGGVGLEHRRSPNVASLDGWSSNGKLSSAESNKEGES